jgi:hypothetical protein
MMPFLSDRAYTRHTALCLLPRRIERVHVSITQPLVQHSSMAGGRIVTFEACSGFTRATAHRVRAHSQNRTACNAKKA